jgi:predicted metal-binding membrane protein
VYQFTGVKDACVSHCRSPLSFIMNEWRPGPVGALRMGARHGTYCVGCCWVLMALLFVLGVMNLWWIAVLAAVVLLEKVLPSVAVTRAVGVGLAAWGIGLLIGIG